MKKFILAALLLLLPLSGFTQSPSQTVRTKESLVKVTWDAKIDGVVTSSFCTGFAVGVTWVVTAGHCMPPKGSNVEVFVNGDLAKILRQDDRFGMLQVAALKYPILELRKERAKVGENITTFGYAYGLPMMALKRSVAALCGCEYAEEDHMMLDGLIAPGMSGGPVVDENGKVLGLNQASMGTLSVACLAGELKDFINGKD